MSKETQPNPSLQISVLVPTHGRPDLAAALLEAFDAQTLPSTAFEVILVDDGSEPALVLDTAGRAYRCTLIRQAQAGPSAARNTGLARCSAPLVLIMNDDTVPAPDLLERHLEAHAEAGPKTAILGTFPFTREAQKSPLVRLLGDSDLLFSYSKLEDRKTYDWTHFWTCNISLSVDALREVGGFDQERFDRPICEDVEVGIRLQDLGWKVQYRANCVAEHNHVLTPMGYMRRAFQLGRFQYRIGVKYNSVSSFFPEDVYSDGQANPQVESYVASQADTVKGFVALLDELEEAFQEQEIPTELAEDAKAGIAQHSRVPQLAGMYFEATGVDPLQGWANSTGASEPIQTAPADPAALASNRAPSRAPSRASADRVPSAAASPSGGGANPVTVSIVLASYNALENTKRCVTALKRAADPSIPQEIIVVDNGSTDGSAEWLRGQSDIEVIFNPENFGAPRARNQAIGRTTGAWVAFLDNDIFVPDNWLLRALRHGEFDKTVGAIPLCANRACRLQVVEYSGSSDEASIQAFADAHYAKERGRGEDATLFTSLGVIVRREVLDRIGGFDETFSPWGFEDDDLSLRIRLAGWRNRVARDTFVFHAHYDTKEKVQRHAVWLEQNWRAFIAKWSPSAGTPDLFDYTNVQVPQLGEALESQLVFPLPADNAAPPEWTGMEPRKGTYGPSAQVTEAVATTRSLRNKKAPSPAAGTVRSTTIGRKRRVPSAEADGAESGRPVTAPTRPANGADVPGKARAATPPARDAASVLIMGCGHSGTHAAAAMLADAGWFACEDPSAARKTRGAGSPKTSEINGINEFLLAGSVTNEEPLHDMQHWLALADGPLDLPEDAAVRHRMDRLGERGPFAYEDPRFCYTLPTWRASVPGAKYVCLFGEPAATAASIMEEVKTAPYLQGCGVDEDRAIEIWDAMYRQVLDQHSHDGEWLFLHVDQLRTQEGVARLEAFVGAPVSANFEGPRPGRSQSAATVSAAVPASVARTFDELCERAGAEPVPIAREPETPAVTEVVEPELTVLVCTSNRKDTLTRCLASFEGQSAAGRYEVVVVNDGSSDGTREWLEDWDAKVPVTVIHREDADMAAARNTGLEAARGRFVLFVNDDTIAFPELVEKHLEAQEIHDGKRAILGTLEQPRAALENALMRVLDEDHLISCHGALEPAALHDFNRFRTSNVSVSLDAVRAVGGFKESFRHRGAEVTDLAYRLEKEQGVRVIYEPGARAHLGRVLDFDEVQRRSRAAASAQVCFFREHPETLGHPFWSDRASHTHRGHEATLVEMLPQRRRAEDFARELSKTDLGPMHRTGPEGEQLAEAVVIRLKEYLAGLNQIWWTEGEAMAFLDFGVDGMADFVGAARPAGASPLSPGASRASALIGAQIATR